MSTLSSPFWTPTNAHTWVKRVGDNLGHVFYRDDTDVYTAVVSIQVDACTNLTQSAVGYFRSRLAAERWCDARLAGSYRVAFTPAGHIDGFTQDGKFEAPDSPHRQPALHDDDFDLRFMDVNQKGNQW